MPILRFGGDYVEPAVPIFSSGDAYGGPEVAILTVSGDYGGPGGGDFNFGRRLRRV